jgi:hypothetical protein
MFLFNTLVISIGDILIVWGDRRVQHDFFGLSVKTFTLQGE